LTGSLAAGWQPTTIDSTSNRVIGTNSFLNMICSSFVFELFAPPHSAGGGGQSNVANTTLF
jgi:hypothetical protein